jgi:hypothetical protein
LHSLRQRNGSCKSVGYTCTKIFIASGTENAVIILLGVGWHLPEIDAVLFMTRFVMSCFVGDVFRLMVDHGYDEGPRLMFMFPFGIRDGCSPPYEFFSGSVMFSPTHSVTVQLRYRAY